MSKSAERIVQPCSLIVSVKYSQSRRRRVTRESLATTNVSAFPSESSLSAFCIEGRSSVHEDASRSGGSHFTTVPPFRSTYSRIASS
jgi:hypothetical protein